MLKKPPDWEVWRDGADDGTRTRTPEARDFKSPVSAIPPHPHFFVYLNIHKTMGQLFLIKHLAKQKEKEKLN